MDDVSQNPEDQSLQSPPPSSTITQEDAPVTLPDEANVLPPIDDVDAFWKFAYEERINELYNENLRLLNDKTLLKWENIHLKKNNDKPNDVVGAGDGYIDELTRVNQINAELLEKISVMEKQRENDHSEKNVLETTIVGINQSLHDLQPIVIKKLLNHTNQTLWQGYSTLEEDEVPVKLSMDGTDLLVGDVVTQKKLVLEGLFSQYTADPFFDDARGYNDFHRPTISQLLFKVVSCNVTDLYLYNQNLQWDEYQKLTSSEMIQNLYFFNVIITHERNNGFAALENILQTVPNIQRFAHLSMTSITKETFKTLFNLHVFPKLQEFKLDTIYFEDFDVDGFHDFMEKHPNTRFSLSFLSGYYDGEIESMKLLFQDTADDKLEIKLQTF